MSSDGVGVSCGATFPASCALDCCSEIEMGASLEQLIATSRTTNTHRPRIRLRDHFMKINSRQVHLIAEKPNYDTPYYWKYNRKAIEL